MIEYLNGELVELMPALAVVEAAGVGYGVNIALPVYSSLAGRERSASKEGERVRLFVHEVIREDEHLLFGFLTRAERELFRALISVSGIGPNTARMIMSGYSASEIRQVIATGNVRALSNIKGIGAKTAQRIIVELKDVVLKIDTGDNLGAVPVQQGGIGSGSAELKSEAVSALTMLGFPAAPAAKVVDKLIADDPSLSVEKVIKQALKML